MCTLLYHISQIVSPDAAVLCASMMHVSESCIDECHCCVFGAVRAWVALAHTLSLTRCLTASSMNRRSTCTATWLVCAHNATTWCKRRISMSSSTKHYSMRWSQATRRCQPIASMSMFSTSPRSMLLMTRDSKPSLAWKSSSRFVCCLRVWLHDVGVKAMDLLSTGSHLLQFRQADVVLGSVE